MPTILRTTRGFTIVELMITLVVAAILAAIAAPSFTAIIQDNRMATQLNELNAALSLARSESIKRNLPVTTCRSNDGNTCGGNWENGWIVFSDDDGDGAFDGGAEQILRTHNAISGGNTLRYSEVINRITYLSTGLTNTLVNNRIFTLCDDRGNGNRTGLVISSTGRVRQAIAGDPFSACP